MTSFRMEGARVWGEKDPSPRVVWIKDDRVVEALPEGELYETVRINDADAWIAPGFIDSHVHVFKYVTGTFGMDADFCGVRQGVPNIIDQGGPSCINIDAFRHFISEPAATNVHCFISAYLAGGLMGHRFVGLYGPTNANAKLVIEAIEANRDLVAGIKVHADHGGFSRWGSELIAEARKMADATGLPLYLHLGTMWPDAEGKSYDPVKVLDETADLLRPGDVLAHPFTRRPSGGILPDGSIHPAFKQAKERGLKIDVGRGFHIDFNNARKVLDAGILPDTLGTDMHSFNCGPTVPPERHYNLFFAMSELAALGIPVDHIINMVTRNCVRFLPAPARTSEAGGPGITVFRIAKEKRTYSDYSNNTIEGSIAFYPVGCVAAGLWHAITQEDMPLRMRKAA